MKTKEKRRCSLRVIHYRVPLCLLVTAFSFLALATSVFSNPLPLDIERAMAQAGLRTNSASSEEQRQKESTALTIYVADDSSNDDVSETQQPQNSMDCAFILSETAMTMGPEGGARSVIVKCDNACRPTAPIDANIPWLRLARANTSNGNLIITYDILPNNSPFERAAAITVANRILTITQTGKSMNHKEASK